MSDSGPGADPRGSNWDNPSWSSSPSDGSRPMPDEQPPNPWSRQASQPGAVPGSGSASLPSALPEPDPYAAPEPAPFEPVPPGFDPQPTPPYGSALPSYPTPPPAYGSNPYEVNSYQPAYGGVSPYGLAPQSHPQATTAMIFGILGTVFGFSCLIGGLLGIPGIVLGRRVRNEIDAQPGRYTGRSQAVAGIVTGIVGVVIAVLGVAVIAVIIAAGFASGEF